MSQTAQLAPRIAAAVLMAGLALPAVAQSAPVVQKAPGRVVFSVDSGAVQRNVDAGGAYIGVALPGAATLMIGGGSVGSNTLYAAKVGLDGALDPSFGTGGVRSFSAPPNTQFGAVSVVRQPDGKLLLISLRRGASGLFGNEKVQVTRLNADLSLDGSYGVGGTALTAIGGTSGAVLQPDGKLVLSGTTGEITTAPAPGQSPPLHWAVARLMPDGGVDAGFGTGGVTTITPTLSSSGANVAIGPGGTIVAEGQAQTSLAGGSQARMLLARLTPAGLPDPAFAGGVPIATPFASGRAMLVQDDGSVVVSGQTQNPDTSIASQSGAATALPRPLHACRRGRSGVRHRRRRRPRPGLRAQPAASVGRQRDPRRRRAGVRAATGLGPDRRTADRSARRAQRRDRADPHRRSAIRWRRLLVHRQRPAASAEELNQNTFLAETVVRRSDGSYIVPGGVHVSQPTGEGVGFSIGRFAAAGLTPAFTLDPSFGGPATAPKLSLRLSLQRARSAYTRHGIRVSLKSSAVGLARVRIKHGNRLIAQSLLPVFKTTRHTLLVGNTKYGNTYLRHHRNVRVTISATGRDLLASTDTATARGRLR